MPQSSSSDDLRARPPAPRNRAATDTVGIPRPGVPALRAPTPVELEALRAAIARHLPEVPAGLVDWRQSALLPVLHDVQEALHYIPPPLVPEIGRALNLSRAEVHGVITYYHHFRTDPPGRHVVQICQAEACRANGAEALLAVAAQHLNCAPGSTRADGAVTLERTYCLGLCATGPSAMIDESPRSRVTAATLAAFAARIEGQA
ncbi:MAG TPA: NAD(P)H-dependent oxidoreductase subunit E [Burkholderiaceae bacterium]|jgi:formate dehydrogenase subunit gamma|nr:NAD(P)H-dependent oxidoreductase subunit E [Burkholderiaceae bacterium]